MTDPSPQEGDLILYRTADDAVRVEVLYESETFWLDQRRMAELFGVDVRTVSYHLKEVYASGELSPEATLRRIWRVQREGNREVRREIEFYNLDAIISVGYRVNSTQATQFRIWATQTLREFILKVSPIVAGRRAMDLRLVGREAFFKFYKNYTQRERERVKTAGGGNFYNARNTRLGQSFALAVMRAALEGRLSFKQSYDLTGLRGSAFQECGRRLGVPLP